MRGLKYWNVGGGRTDQEAVEVGFHTSPLCLATEYGGAPVLPVLCEASEQTLPRTREVFG